MNEKQLLIKYKEVINCINYGSSPTIKDGDIYRDLTTLERANFNKDMIHYKWFIRGYLDVEEFLKHCTKRTKLPDWIPLGQERV